jgi:MFS family permease
MLLFGLVGGVVADRFPKRNVLLLTQAIIGLAAAINAVLVLTDVIQIWHLFLVSALQGTGFAFNMPSRQAFVAQLVPRDRLMNAVALNNSGMNFARVIGPSIAGVLIGLSFVGAGGVFVLMTLMYVYVVVSLLRIPQRGEPQQHTGAGTRPPPLTALRDGLGYVRSNVVVFTLLMLAFVPVLLGMPYQSLMPVFAADVFDVESEGLGLLLTVNGIGALIGSLTIATMTQIQRRGLLQMTLGIVFGVALAGFAFSGSFVVALVALLFVGVASAGFQSLNSTLVMAHADPKYHGRVMSVYMLTFSAMPLAVIPFGIFADQVGAPLTIGIGGIMLAVVIGLIGLLHPTYRHIR